MITDFGPDTAGSPIPWPPLFFYYAVFFGFEPPVWTDIFENARRDAAVTLRWRCLYCYLASTPTKCEAAF